MPEERKGLDDKAGKATRARRYRALWHYWGTVRVLNLTQGEMGTAGGSSAEKDMI